MEYYILKELILFCKNNSFEMFIKRFKHQDVFALLGIPEQPMVNVYNMLRSTILVNLKDGWDKLSIDSASIGNQPKYINRNLGKFIKLRYSYGNTFFKDYFVEILASNVFSSSVLGVNILQQNLVLTNEGFGVISDVFTTTEQTYESFYQVARKHSKLNLPKFDIPRMDRLMTIYEDYIKVDAIDYLLVMIFIDCVVLNEDRHLRNFGYLRDKSSNVLPPLFDFGQGLFENKLIYKDLNLKEALLEVEHKPFNHDNLTVLKALYDTHLREKITYLHKNMHDVSHLVFPNKLAIEYYSYIRKELSALCEH